ncbi:MAG: transcriptional regulator [Deltaproteobacteria bacterium]|nr:transcriptional regulator [Deltaproteobacteria bacterium]
MSNDLTARQRIIEALKGGMLTAKDISRAVGLKEKDVIDHLPHVAKSIEARKGGGVRFIVEPSRCLDCGFVFRKRERLKSPGKCPICKGEGITEARYGIVDVE